MIKFYQSSNAIETGLQDKISKSYKKLMARPDIGFFKLPDRTPLLSAIQKRSQELAQKFDTMVVLGIGGSSLSVRVIHEIFAKAGDAKKLQVWDNVDGFQFEKDFAELADLNKTCWVIISKSGSTIETIVQTDLVAQKYKEKKISFYDKVTAVTEQRENPLFNWAKAHEIPSLEIPLDVGGRFSALTAVGLLPASFLGLQIDQMMAGAKLALKDEEKIVKFSAEVLQSFKREEWITVFWFYCSRLRWFGDWVMQLWGESLAKKVNLAGAPAARVSTPLTLIGACDQHSALQQVMEGSKDKFVVFFHQTEAQSVGETIQSTEFPGVNYIVGRRSGDLLKAQATATSQALNKENVSTLTGEIEALDEKGVGYLMMFMQLVVGAIGESIEINTFNQPGVELGKKIAKEILTSTEARR